MILSVELNDSNIKIMEASKSGKILNVFKCISLNFSQTDDPGNIDNIDNIDKIANIIKESLIKNDIKTKQGVFIINTNKVIIRRMYLPILRKSSETLSMIKYELDQILPVDLNHYKIVYYIDDSNVNNYLNKSIYVVYCLPVEIIAQYKELAQKSGIKLTSLELSFNCLNKICENKLTINDNMVNNKVTAFVYIGKDDISFNVLNNKISDFSRKTNISSKKYSQEKVAETPAIYMGESIEETYYRQPLLDEINKYIRYYNSINNEDKISKMYIYGVSSLIKGVSKSLSLNLNIDVEVINKISNVEISESNLNDLNGSLVNEYFISLLALFNNEKNKDFLLDNFKLSIFFRKYIAVVLLMIFLVTMVAAVGLKSLNSKFNNDIDSMILFIKDEENIKLHNEIVNLKNDVELLNGCIQQAKSVIDILNTEDFVSSEIFREIYKAKPLNTKVTSISLNRKSIQIICTSNSMGETALFLNNLRKTDMFVDIFVPTIEVNEKSNYLYTIFFQLGT